MRCNDDAIGRLTYEKSKSSWDRGKYPTKYTSRHTFQEVVARLAAYEDTGLEPEDIEALQKREQGLAELLVNVSCGCAVPYTRLAELAQAEKDGRLVVLPCKVGDKVYRVITTASAAPTITEIEIKTLGQAADLIGRIGEKKLLVSWYLTRAEAEAALKKREEADNETD